jgi:hypothetical protein
MERRVDEVEMTPKKSRGRPRVPEAATATSTTSNKTEITIQLSSVYLSINCHLKELDC